MDASPFACAVPAHTLGCCREGEAGRSLTIPRDGRPLALVTPVEPGDAAVSAHERLMTLLRKGIAVDHQGSLDRDALRQR